MDKELKRNIKQIKQLLTLPDYDKIDEGVELAISLEEPKIFENLLNGCTVDFTIEGGYEGVGTGGGVRPILNHWLSKLQIQNGKILDQPTGYYVFISLILNFPKDTNIDDSLKLENITELSLKNCWMQKLPPSMSKLSELKILDISFNRELKESKSNLTTLPKLEYIIDHETYLDHGFVPKFTLKTNDTSCECNGCNESFESQRDMVKRYDGNFCSSCDESWNDLRFRCFCCSQTIDPTINDYKIDFEAKVASNDTLFSEEYDCREEYSTKALFVDNTIIFKTICSYCEQDSRLSDEEFESFIIKIQSGEIPKETVSDNDHFSYEETGLTDHQYEIISEFNTKGKDSDDGQAEDEDKQTEEIRNGLYETFHENGQLHLRENYKDGELDGLFEVFHENGELSLRGNHKDGKMDGLVEEFHESGQLNWRGNYKDGEREGLYEEFRENGQLQLRGTFKDGKMDGLWEGFNENGQLEENENYCTSSDLMEPFDPISKRHFPAGDFSSLTC